MNGHFPIVPLSKSYDNKNCEPLHDYITLNKISNWSSLLNGHPLYLILARSMKDITWKLYI